ncbi:MAG: peptide chain release factor N(5)-glutamine methyltransferase [Deltaproteobacteria bacterium]|nr:peptide chain release factor N(5)-glutamine methyltransferase [Deltaproteobacteria bacterium]
MHKSWDIKRLIKWSAEYLKKRGIDAPRLTSELLLASALNCSRLDLYLHYDKPLKQEELSAFKVLLKRRLAHEPLPYILGEKEFFSLRFKVTPATFIPRPETERLVEVAVEIIKGGHFSQPYILDWGTGCGAIAICLAKELIGAHIIATDISKEALECAKQNARLHKVSIGLIKSRDLGCFKEGYLHFIVSNPPYIRTATLNKLAPEIKDYEPRYALDGGPDGLKYISYLINQCPRYIRKGGWLIMEIGYDQKKDIERLIPNSYDPPIFFKDYIGHVRVIALKVKD